VLELHYFPVTLFTHPNAAHSIVACAGLAGRGCVRYVVEADLLVVPSNRPRSPRPRPATQNRDGALVTALTLSSSPPTRGPGPTSESAPGPAPSPSSTVTVTVTQVRYSSIAGDIMICVHRGQIYRNRPIFGPAATMCTVQWLTAVNIALLFTCVDTFRPGVALRSPFPLRLRTCGASPAVQGRAGGVPRFAMQQDPDRSFRVSWSSGMQSTSAAASFNLAKAIVGAGSFSLPYVCKNQGVLGGLITISSCAMLAWYTMQVQARCYPPVPRDYFLRPVYACACLHVCFEWMSSLALSPPLSPPLSHTLSHLSRTLTHTLTLSRASSKAKTKSRQPRGGKACRMSTSLSSL